LIGGLTPQQLAFFAILVVGFALLLTEWLRADVVGVLLVLSLYGTGVLEARQALSGFGSEPAIVVAAIFVLSGALYQTGLSEIAGGWIGRLAGTAFMLLLGRFLLPTRRGGGVAAEHFRLDEYFTEVAILEDSPFLGKTLPEVEEDPRYRLGVAGWVRDGRTVDRQREGWLREELSRVAADPAFLMMVPFHGEPLRSGAPCARDLAPDPKACL
jgi:hypothetical protein